MGGDTLDGVDIDVAKAHTVAQFDTASQIARVHKCIRNIKELAKELPIISAEEKEASQKVLDAFDSRMKRMMCATYDNVEKYQLMRWKELFGLDGGENESNTTI